MINYKLIISCSKSLSIQDSYFGQASVEVTSKRAGNEQICRQFFSLYGCGCALLLCLPRGVLSGPGDITTALKPSTTASSRPFTAGPCGHWRCWVAALQGVSVRGSRWDCMDLPSSAPSPTPWLGFSANSILSYRLTDVTPRKYCPWIINILLKAFNTYNWSNFDCTVPGII